MRWLVSLPVLLAIGAVAAMGQSPPSFAAPADLSAGFNPNILGKPPAPVREVPPAEAAIKKKIWSGGVELGLAGSTGNSDVFKFRFGFNSKRDTERNDFFADFLFGLAQLNGRTNENKALLLLRDEFALGKSKRWSIFLADTLEYDQFRAFDFREALHSGINRTWIKSDRTTFKTRFGAGTSFDLNTVTKASRWVPEGLFGYDLDFKFTPRQRIVSSADYFPNFGEFGQFRVRIRAAYEFIIDPELGLVLRMGVQDRYDSSPGATRINRNDLDYFTTILLAF